MPIDAISGISGSEWVVAPTEQPDTIGAPDAGSAAGGGDARGFGSLLGDAVSSLTKTQTEAADGAQALAAGSVNDPTAVVMAVERAQLAMQLASQVRNKVVEAANDLFHTQI
jgi:flagellar hook-basal body complex protein FliE